MWPSVTCLAGKPAAASTAVTAAGPPPVASLSPSTTAVLRNAAAPSAVVDSSSIRYGSTAPSGLLNGPTTARVALALASTSRQAATTVSAARFHRSSGTSRYVISMVGLAGVAAGGGLLVALGGGSPDPFAPLHASAIAVNSATRLI